MRKAADRSDQVPWRDGVGAAGENSRIAAQPPNAAPDEMPRICGPTSGLRKAPCNAAPHLRR